MSDRRVRALEYLTGGWFGDMIRSELAANGNDPNAAVANVSEWANEHLGQHGCCTDDHRIEVYGTVKSSKGAKVWYGKDHWDRDHDEIISWSDMFGYVAGDAQQLTLL
jgi:hypothetical protein